MGGLLSTLPVSTIEAGEKIDVVGGTVTVYPGRNTAGIGAQRDQVEENLLRDAAEREGLSVQEYLELHYGTYQRGNLGESGLWSAGGAYQNAKARYQSIRPQTGAYASDSDQGEYGVLTIGPDEFGVSLPRIDDQIRNVAIWRPLKNPEPAIVRASGLGVVLVLARHRLQLSASEREFIRREAVNYPSLRVLLEPDYTEYAVQPIYPDAEKRPTGKIPVYAVPDLRERQPGPSGERVQMIDFTLEFAVYEITDDYITFISSNGEVTPQQTYTEVRDLISSGRGRGPAFRTALSLALASISDKHVEFFKQVLPNDMKRVYGNDAFVTAELPDEEVRFV